MKKIAVIVFNLGGPDCAEAIEPFLFNFFMDKNIISLPYPLRYLLARKISKSRSKKESAANYGRIGGASPLLENTKKQATLLENILNKSTKDTEYKVFVSMRYWKPRAQNVAMDVQNWRPDKIVTLPLYPQFSTTTTGSSLEEWAQVTKAANFNIPSVDINSYPVNKGFLKASAENIEKAYNQAVKDGYKKLPRLLFSAHGLPEKIIRKGDPYQKQCEESAVAIVKTLQLDDVDWVICYQSRVGRLKWIGPSIDEELKRAANDGVSVVIYPHSFTQEHVETLVELDIEYKNIAADLGIKGYYRADTVGTNSAFIKGLAQMVQECA